MSVTKKVGYLCWGGVEDAEEAVRMCLGATATHGTPREAVPRDGGHLCEVTTIVRRLGYAKLGVLIDGKPLDGKPLDGEPAEEPAQEAEQPDWTPFDVEYERRMDGLRELLDSSMSTGDGIAKRRWPIGTCIEIDFIRNGEVCRTLLGWVDGEECECKVVGYTLALQQAMPDRGDVCTVRFTPVLYGSQVIEQEGGE